MSPVPFIYRMDVALPPRRDGARTWSEPALARLYPSSRSPPSPSPRSRPPEISWDLPPNGPKPSGISPNAASIAKSEPPQVKSKSLFTQYGLPLERRVRCDSTACSNICFAMSVNSSFLISWAHLSANMRTMRRTSSTSFRGTQWFPEMVSCLCCQ